MTKKHQIGEGGSIGPTKSLHFRQVFRYLGMKKYKIVR
jgi:hypothetical protein